MIHETKFSKQSTISAILLIILCSISAVVLYIHTTTDRSPFIPQSPLRVSNQPYLSKISNEYSPFCILPSGFRFFGEKEVYSQGSLFKKINGKAPLYVEAGFVQLTCQKVINTKDSALWFEVYLYEMKNVDNSFTVYSTQRRSDVGNEAALGLNHHYKTENGLYLWLGQYYVEIIGSSQSPVLEQAMIEVSFHLFNSLPAEQSIIDELKLFPPKNRVSNSFKLNMQNTFGTEILKKTFTARYRLEGKGATAFICVCETNEQAQKIFADYTSFLINNGAQKLESKEKIISFFELYGTIDAYFTHGIYVVGVHEAEDLQIARKITLQLKRKFEETLEP